MLRTHNHINSLIRRAAALLLALSLAAALPALATPAGGGAEAYAKGNLAAGDTVKNVLVYVTDSEGNDVLLSRLMPFTGSTLPFWSDVTEMDLISSPRSAIVIAAGEMNILSLKHAFVTVAPLCPIVKA
jgi:hypothetical protein